MEKKLDLINNAIGVMGSLYTFMLLIIFFIFKEKADQILKIAIPIFLLLAIMLVLALFTWSYLRKRIEDLENIQQRIKKLENYQKLDHRFRKIEEKLIKQEHTLDIMKKSTQLFALNKKGNSVLLGLLILLLIALLIWLVWFLRVS